MDSGLSRRANAVMISDRGRLGGLGASLDQESFQLATPSARSRKILLVERDLPSAHDTVKQFAALGLETEVVKDPQAGLQRMVAQAYLAVLCDVTNPRMAGPQIIQVARSVKPAVPVVLLAASVHPRDLVKAYRMGVFDCLLKPFTRGEVEEILQRLPSGPAVVEEAPLGSRPTPIHGMQTVSPAIFTDVHAPLPVPGLAAQSTVPGPPAPRATTGPLFEPEEPPSGLHEGPLRVRLERHIERDVLDLPIPAQLVRKLMELQAESDPAAEEVVAVLQSSAQLGASIIRAARASDISRASAAPVTVQDALIRLGTNRALRTALTTASHAMSHDLLSRRPDLVHDLWLHHLVSARAAEHLARELLPSIAATIHPWALFMEVGELVVLRALDALSPEVFSSGAGGQGLTEARAWVVDLHGQAGRVAMRRWQLPPVIAELATAHTHEVAAGHPPSSSQKTVMVLRAARGIAMKLLQKPTPTAPHALTPKERAAWPELDDALLERAGRQALEDAQQIISQHR
jgi:HD-like signal output (HDOD) protein/ActR/RegA family two-component response regulator